MQHARELQQAREHNRSWRRAQQSSPKAAIKPSQISLNLLMSTEGQSPYGASQPKLIPPLTPARKEPIITTVTQAQK